MPHRADKSRLRDADLPREGEQIDNRYVVKNIIGRGGMSCIVRAQQLTMNRDVAIKLLHPHVASDELTVARFEREVHLAKGLTHPNIIQYYDYGSLPNGSMYLVMELLEGCDLHTLIRREANLSMHRSMNIIMQVLDGLSEAHGKAVVHRDLKPRNLFMLDLSRGGDYVKILDFGIAKSTQSGESELTRTGVVCGTPSYLAPELLITQDAGPPSDLYSVGLIFLEMLTGRRVFKGDTMARTFFMQLRQPVPIPIRFIDTPMEDFLLRALAKHPDDRFQTAHQMMDALDELRAQMPHDIHLDPDDVDSMSRSRAAVLPGASATGGRGLDILRDEAWVVTSRPPIHQLDSDDDMPTTLAELRGGPPIAPPSRSLERRPGSSPVDSAHITNPVRSTLARRAGEELKGPAGEAVTPPPRPAKRAPAPLPPSPHENSKPSTPPPAGLDALPPALPEANTPGVAAEPSEEALEREESTSNSWKARAFIAGVLVVLLAVTGVVVMNHIEGEDSTFALPHEVSQSASAQTRDMEDKAPGQDSNFAFVDRLEDADKAEKPADKAADEPEKDAPAEKRTEHIDAPPGVKEKPAEKPAESEPKEREEPKKDAPRSKPAPEPAKPAPKPAKPAPKPAKTAKTAKPAPKPAKPAPKPKPPAEPAPSSMDEFMKDNTILGD